MATKSKAVATVEDEATDVELVEISPEEQALIDANRAEVDTSEFIVPIVKLAQPLTDEVTSGDAKAGDYILSLTGEAIEGPFEFIVAGKAKGRFKPGRDGERTLVSYDEKLVPWTDDPFYGKPFSEHPDAEENYGARVNAGEIEWGSGPTIQTTYNYTGYIVGNDIPVRISLRRTSAPTAKKLNMYLDAALGGRYWKKTFLIDSEQKKNAKGAYYVATVDVVNGREPTAEEQQKVLQLAGALRRNAVAAAGDVEDTPMSDPGDTGGLDM